MLLCERGIAMLQLYENIKNLRIEMNMTQSDLAQKMGYADKSMIAKIEKGTIDLPQSKIIAFANALHVSPGSLMGWDEAEPPKIIQYYDQLNTTGKEAATEQVRLLTLDEKYTRPGNLESIIQEPEPDYLVLKAAHNDAPIDDEELEKMNRDIELLKRLQNKGK